MFLRKALKVSVVIFALLFVAAQGWRPSRVNPPVNPAQTLEANTTLPPEVAAIFARSCNDCHSNQTRYPWYSNISPASWFLADHIDEGRAEMNFSEWGSYSRRMRETRLAAICAECEHGMMPLSSYTLIHRDGVLSTEDVRAICEWTRTESSRLNVAAP